MALLGLASCAPARTAGPTAAASTVHAAAAAAPVAGDTMMFLARSVVVGTTVHPYRVYLPPAAPLGRAAAARLPVILFLHGAGERGDDGVKPTLIGLGPAIRALELPAIAVFPQAPLDSAWYGVQAAVALAALDQTIAEFGGDPERVYLTGLSMGGYGALRLAAAHADRFAAVVAICGGVVAPADRPYLRWRDVPLDISLYEWTADRLRDVPVWLFHGADDPIIPVTESRRLAAALEAAGATVRYTEYSGVGHGAWDPAYAEPQLWAWMFAQRR